MEFETAGLDQHQRLRIIWGAFVAAAAIYAVAPYLKIRLGGDPEPMAVHSALYFAAAGAAVSSFVARRWWTHAISAAQERRDSPDNIVARLTLGCLVTWGLAEAVTIIGTIAALFAHDPSAALPFVFACVALLILHRPSVWPGPEIS
jgi:hypothetical protein